MSGFAPCTGDQGCGGAHSTREALPGCFWERKPHPLYDRSEFGPGPSPGPNGPAAWLTTCNACECRPMAPGQESPDQPGYCAECLADAEQSTP